MFCCTKFFSDNQCHRALVLDLEEGTWEVLFIDYGNTEVVSADDLVPLTDQLAALPMIVFQCKLHQVEPAEGTTWTEEACSCFRNLVLNKPMNITLRGTKSQILVTSFTFCYHRLGLTTSVSLSKKRMLQMLCALRGMLSCHDS